ncbi:MULTISPECIES: N-acetyltransferase [Halorussus]|uniref:GNAT family N-acetyltransferase n=1 Tax=Halorussus TaxID=1070314 RepID=UPI000E210DAA|nr:MULTISPECIES: GNAT family N-acetyltransferase [Halorussus]NHN61324.1 GNAT family N-acetyltransferase [Halorussus sp. JP-T4]
MELIEATEDDLDALVERWYSLAKAMEAYDELNELAYTAVDAVPDDGFRAHLDDEAITDYLIRHEEETIGFVTLREGHHSSRQYSKYLRIVNIAIDESHRNQGRGTKVIERVKEMARDRGCDHLKVSCEWHNEDVRRFYRDTGFRPKQVDYAQPLE